MKRILKGYRHDTKNVNELMLLRVTMASLALSIPFLVVYWQSHGISVREILIMQAVFSISSVILEVPSGYCADRFGRKNVILLGCLFAVFAALLYVGPACRLSFYLSEICFGIGFSFISGADTALLFDSLKQDKKAHLFSQVQSQMVQAHMSSAFLFGLIGGLLVMVSMRLTWVCVLALFLLAVVLASRMQEVDISDQSAEVHKEPLLGYLGKLIKQDSTVLPMFFVSAIVASVLQSAFWLYQPSWIASGVPHAWFGVVFAVLNLWASVSIVLIQRFSRSQSDHSKMVILLIAVGVAILLSGLALGTWLCMLPILVHQSSRSARQIWIDDALNRRIESSWRASINSLNSLGGRLLYAGMLLILGPIVEYGGLEVAHLSMSAVLLITLSWYVIDYRLRQKKLS